jgi:hypothetical protein
MIEGALIGARRLKKAPPTACPIPAPLPAANPRSSSASERKRRARGFFNGLLKIAAEIEMLDALVLGEIGGSAGERDRAGR